MSEKKRDSSFPDSDDNPSFEDVSSEDENEVTVILPDDATENVGQEMTEEVLGSKAGDVFVLLPDGDDSKIPMVETQEVGEVTEAMDRPRLSSVYESSTASQLGLRSENPLQFSAPTGDTEIDPYGAPTEEYVTDQATETMSAGDLDDFASEVADDMAASTHDDAIDYDESYDDEDEPYEVEAYPRRRSQRGSPFKRLVLSLAALVAIAAAGAQFYPEYLGLDPSFDLRTFAMEAKTFVMKHVNTLMGRPAAVADGGPPVSNGGGTDGGPPTPPPVAMAVQETFKSNFKQAIELGFAGEAPR